MNGHRRRAFTLAELMAVVTIIALVAAILVPFFQKAFAVQKKVQCANNLEKLGQAYATRPTEALVDGRSPGALSTTGWMDELSRYVGGSQDIFICPEDDTGTGQDPLATLKDVYVDIYIDGWNYKWSVAMDETVDSPWVWRMSEEDFAGLDAAPNHGIGYNYTGYKPGKDPTTYWFTFEDQGWRGGGDKDYWDILLKVHYSDQGIEIKPRQGVAAYNFKLSIDEGGGKKKYLSEDLKATAAAGETIIIPGGFGDASYGINSVVERITAGKNVLLLLDYDRLWANGSDLEARALDDWSSDKPPFTKRPDGLPLFARHFNKANVLFANGAVHLMSLSKINPRLADNRRLYWNPREK